MYRIAARPVRSVHPAEAGLADVPGRTVWRFYMTKERCWKWQRVTASGSMVDESREAYPDFESCVAGAQTNGYVFQRPQGKTISRTH
jgi:hypothetical protein